MARIRRTNQFTGTVGEMEIDVDPIKVANWISKKESDPHNTPYIQDAFPELNASEREFILTGITQDQWDNIFPEEDIEDDISF